MADDKTNPDKNQSNVPIFNTNQNKPIFESVPVEEAPVTAPEIVQPEEVSSDISNTDQAFTSAPPEILPDDLPPVYDESKSKYFIIGGAIIFFIIILVVIFRLLLGSRSSTTTAKKEVILTYWGLWEDKEVMQPLIDEYQSKNPNIKINYQKMVPKEYREKLLARARNGEGPDIFRFHNTWLPEIQDVVAYIPDSVMDNKTFEDTFYSIHQKDLKIGTHYYGIPLTIDGLVLVYNDDLLKQAGISAPPTRWVEDVPEVVKKITVLDKDDHPITSGMAIGTTANVEHFPEIYGILLLLNGGDLKKLNSPEAADALQLYREFAENKYWDETMPNSVTAFAQGKVAMVLVPSWQILVIKAINPDINLKVAQTPKGLGGKSLSISTYWVEGVSKFSKNQPEAWNFLKFLSQKESQEKLYEQQAKTRLFGEPYSRKDLGEKLLTNEYLRPVIEQADSYVTVPLASRTFDNGLNDEIIKYIENAINATSQGVSYQSALDTAQKGVSQVLQKFNIN